MSSFRILPAVFFSFVISQISLGQCASDQLAYEISFINGGNFPSDRSWEIVPADGGAPVISAECGEFQTGTFDFCLDEGVDYTFNAYDDRGDGWGFFGLSDPWVISLDGEPLYTAEGSPDNGQPGDSVLDCAESDLEFSFSFNSGFPDNCIPPILEFYETPNQGSPINVEYFVEILDPNGTEGSTVELIFQNGPSFPADTFYLPNTTGTFASLGVINLSAQNTITYNVVGFQCPVSTSLTTSLSELRALLTDDFCQEGVTETYCYTNNDEISFGYKLAGGGPLSLGFNAGLIESCCDEIFIYEGSDDQGPLLFGGNNGGDLSGVLVTANSGELFLQVSTDFSISCVFGNSGTSPWTWSVSCGEVDILGCTDPTAINFEPNANVDDGSCLFPASNDEPCGAIGLECGLAGDVIEGSFTTATLSDSIAPLEGCGLNFNPPNADLWYTFDADGSSVYEINGLNSNGLFLALYSGNACDSLTEFLPCSDFPFFSGIFPQGTYYLLVRPEFADPIYNEFELTFRCVPPVFNDEPCGAPSLVCNPESLVVGFFLGATETIPDPCSSSLSRDVWYTFQANGISSYLITEEGFLGDVLLGVYEADTCTGALVEIESCISEDQTIQFLDEGTYFLRLSPVSDALNYLFSFTCLAPVPNDLPCNAIPLACDTGTVSGTTLGATPDEQCGGSTGGAGVWYEFDAPYDGVLELDFCNPNPENYNVDVSVFTGTCDNLECLDFQQSNNDCSPAFLPILNLAIAEGERYYILVHGALDEGNFAFDLSCSSTLDCPDLGNIGDPCDDANSGTYNDVVGADCTCAGIDTCGVPYPPVDPQSLATQLTGNAVATGWNPLPAQVGCQIQVRNLNMILGTQTIPGASADGFSIPLSVLDPTTQYAWRVRCGCSANPLVTGPYSPWQPFVTPIGLEIFTHPSPTDGVSNVAFSMSTEGASTLEVIDLTGRTVEVLHRGWTQANQEYRFTFDGTDLPNGIYLYRLSTDREVKKEKFVIAR